MTKLVKTDSEITVAGSFAASIDDALGVRTCGYVVLKPNGRCVNTSAAYGDLSNRLVDAWESWVIKMRLENPNTSVDGGLGIIGGALNNAVELEVELSAPVDFSDCGCIWARNTTHRYGKGDVILRACAEHTGPQGRRR